VFQSTTTGVTVGAHGQAIVRRPNQKRIRISTASAAAVALTA